MMAYKNNAKMSRVSLWWRKFKITNDPLVYGVGSWVIVFLIVFLCGLVI